VEREPVGHVAAHSNCDLDHSSFYRLEIRYGHTAIRLHFLPL
jgi:hypothetical protein